MNLTLDHYRAIHQRLKRRHRATGDRGLLAVGLGWALKDGKPDSQRGQVIIYLVRKKKKLSRLLKSRRIPREVAVYLTEGKGKTKRRRRTVLKTDVIELPQAVQTSFMATPSDIDSPFTVAALVSWGSASQLSWGLLTVGHGLANSGTNLAEITINSSTTFSGTVIAKTSESDWLDAALIQLDNLVIENNLQNFLPQPGDPPAKVRTISQLVSDANLSSDHPAGYFITPEGPQNFLIWAYFENPPSNCIQDAPNRRHFLLVKGVPGEFCEGRSGSIWLSNQGFVDAIQIAAFPPTMSDGIGQPMEDYLDWAQSQPDVGGQPVRLIATF